MKNAMSFNVLMQHLQPLSNCKKDVADQNNGTYMYIYSTHLKHKCQINLVRIVQGLLKMS